ncbi:MAG: IPT/TIG domain-containing protein [Solirubrobacterales bacterium]|nr:IPT/TIG domain-containing protein [Solirubrobacterales bacterium]
MQGRHRHEEHVRHGREERRRPRRTAFAATLAIGALGLLGAAGAQASTVTVGSVLPPGSTPAPFGEVKTLFNAALPEKGANLVSPVSGAIVRWQVQGAKGGPFLLRVLHPTGTGAFTAVGTSGAATPANTGLQTFTANVPIHAGDLIGIDPTNTTDEIGIATVAGASTASIFSPPFEGATKAPNGGESGKEIELSAEVQPTPVITAVSPSSGSVAGGAKVTITGTDFNTASAVKFGTKAATTYTVGSETQISATVPASTKVNRVDISVTTIAGTSVAVSADRFSYQGCVVPKLSGKKLPAAKSLLRGADCKLGKVTKLAGATAKTGVVAKQSPKSGKVLVPGAKVKVSLAVDKK